MDPAREMELPKGSSINCATHQTILLEKSNLNRWDTRHSVIGQAKKHKEIAQIPL